LVNSGPLLETPNDVISAAQRDQVDAEGAQNAWKASFSVPGIQEWIELFFRGIRGRSAFETAANYFRIPPEFHTDLIDARRPLIPFRTIPIMLASEVIDEVKARSLLGKHGFATDDIDLLIDYSNVLAGRIKHRAVGELKDISIGSMKMLWEQHAITDVQYHEGLVDHGYSTDEADLTLKVESIREHALQRNQIREHALQRKQDKVDIVNEVLAGTITREQAIETMNTLQFTTAERAGVLRTIEKTQRVPVKKPSESELRAMHSKGVIDLDTYKQGLIEAGYDARWADNFARLHFPTQEQVVEQPATHSGL